MFPGYTIIRKIALLFCCLPIIHTIFETGINGSEKHGVNAVIELFDGSRFVGSILAKSIPFTAELIGEIEVPVERIKYYKRASQETNSVLKTINSDNLTGNMRLKEIIINTSVGDLRVPVDKVKMLVINRVIAQENLLKGLISRWCAEGNTKDLVGGENGELLFGAEYSDGKVGKAFSFNNLQARVHIPDSEKFKFRSSFTIECWVFANQLKEGSGMIICSRGDNRPGKDTFHIGTNNKDFNFYISSEEDWCMVTAPGKEKEWIHLAGVWDKDKKEIRLYLNGEKVGQKKTELEPIWELEPTTDTGIGIGNHPGKFHVFPFDGKVDELGIYNRALSDDEIRYLYEAGERGEHIVTSGALLDK